LKVAAALAVARVAAVATRPAAEPAYQPQLEQLQMTRHHHTQPGRSMQPTTA